MQDFLIHTYGEEARHDIWDFVVKNMWEQPQSYKSKIRTAHAKLVHSSKGSTSGGRGGGDDISGTSRSGSSQDPTECTGTQTWRDNTTDYEVQGNLSLVVSHWPLTTTAVFLAFALRLRMSADSTCSIVSIY